MKTTDINHRILLIDDNPAIHQDFNKILAGEPSTDPNFAEAKAAFFDEAPAAQSSAGFQIDSAFQGQEGLAKIETALSEGQPYAMAFVDVRMPPGWDGIETIRNIWNKYPELQVVICTAYSDYSWEEIIRCLGQSDSLLILKKPFDNAEVLQLAHALTKKWTLTQQARLRLEDLDRAVTERTEELRASEERFAKAFKSNPLPMAIQSTLTEEFLDVNDSFVALCGYAREELVGSTPTALGFWQDAAIYEKFLLAIQQNKSVRDFRTSWKIKSGELRQALVFAELFSLGIQPCLLTLVQDVSDRVNLEAQLRQAQKMEAVGQLAAGVAHDFNNILTIVQGHLGLVLASKKIPAPEDYSVKQALAASERAGNLTRQLLAFSRKQIIERKPVKLEALLAQLGGMLQRLIGEQILTEFLIPSGLPAIHADPCNIEQVIMNLALNARDAMPKGGRLTFSAEVIDRVTSRSFFNPEAGEGRFVCLSVTDTGCGMDAATRSHIFEPFFTTKEIGKGTGMGLATVYGIIKQHRGWLEVDSEVGHGTTFRVYLPISPESAGTTLITRQEAVPIACKGNETILAVEDEPALREFVQCILETHGYRVLTAGSGPTALKIWQQYSGQICLLLTDMVMPGGMSGKDLAQAIGRQSPDLKVIFMSGYSLDLVGEDRECKVGFSLLPKPYQGQALVNAVRACLDTADPNGVAEDKRWLLAGAV